MKDILNNEQFVDWFCYLAERHQDEIMYEPLSDYQQPLVDLINKHSKTEVLPLAMIGGNGDKFGIRFVDVKTSKRWELYTDYERLIIKQL